MQEDFSPASYNTIKQNNEKKEIFHLYAVIDIGSNTIRLVIYKIEDGRIRALLNKKSPAGLAGYVSKENILKKSGIQKAVAVLTEFREILQYIPVKEVFPFATASLRNINNAPEVLDAIRLATGFSVRILSGEEEAIFDYYGALQTTDMSHGLLTDIGGGSTELVLYENQAILTASSLPIGSLNLYRRFVKHLIPEKDELHKIRKEVRRQLKTLPDPKRPVRHLCAIGGTARAALQMVQSCCDMEPFAPNTYPPDYLQHLLNCAEENPKAFIKELLHHAPDRVHTFLPGIAVLYSIADFYGIESIATVHYGVREGYLYHLLEQRGEIHG